MTSGSEALCQSLLSAKIKGQSVDDDEVDALRDRSGENLVRLTLSTTHLLNQSNDVDYPTRSRTASSEDMQSVLCDTE